MDLAVNPTVGVKRVHKGGKGHQPWPQDLIDRFMVQAPPALAFAVRLGLYTGQRRSDTVKMMWTQFDGEIIEVRQQKTDELLGIPCHEKLRAELKTMPRIGKTILIGERGHSLTAHSLGVLVSRALRGMGVTGYSIHGLRKNAAKALAEAGCSDAEIMSVTGHRTNEMVRLYTRQAEQRRMARQAMDKLEAPASSRKRFGTDGKLS